eukprot:g1937.t1
MSHFLDDVLGEHDIELLKEAQYQTLTSLQEARSLLHEVNFQANDEQQKIKEALEKKVAVLDEMRSDLVHIYSQLSFIEEKITQLESSQSNNSTT